MTPTQGSEGRSSESNTEVAYGTSLPLWVPITILLLFVALGGWAYYSANQIAESARVADERANAIAADLVLANAQSEGKIAELQGELNVLSRRLGVASSELQQARAEARRIEEARRANDEALGVQIGQVRQESAAKIGEVATGLGDAENNIAATRRDLEATRARLTSAIGDVTGHSTLIARTRDELEALRRLGDRTIYDFNLVKSKTPQRVGPIQMRLTNADAKKNKYTVLVTVDDRSVEKKDRTVAEPMQFLVRGVRAPYEVVVMEVSKDRITGYLSTPKQ